MEMWRHDAKFIPGMMICKNCQQRISNEMLEIWSELASCPGGQGGGEGGEEGEGRGDRGEGGQKWQSFKENWLLLKPSPLKFCPSRGRFEWSHD